MWTNWKIITAGFGTSFLTEVVSGTVFIQVNQELSTHKLVLGAGQLLFFSIPLKYLTAIKELSEEGNFENMH